MSPNILAIRPAARPAARRISLIAGVFGLLAAACWGFCTVAAKAALDGGIPPLALATVQLTASVAVFSIATLITAPRIVWPRRAHATGAALSGVLEYSVTYALAALGLALTTAGNAAIIGAAEPALIVLAAALILGEHAGRKLLMLLALVTAGLLLVVLPDLASTGAPGLGDLLIFSQAVTGAIYAVFSRRLVATIAPVPLSLIQQSTGLAALLVVIGLVAWTGWIAPEWEGLGGFPATLGLAVLSGLLQHVVAVWLHLHALKRMPAGTFALSLAMVPVFALAAAYAVLGEDVMLAQLLGGALILSAAISAGRIRQ
jgi:drug/metabolite transporter (DMT)-like permease